MDDFETTTRNEIAAYETRIIDKQRQIRDIEDDILILQKGIQMRKLFLGQSETLILEATKIRRGI